ncbi:Fur family transcriptional regulator [Patescibacteria group bacterium]
MKSRNTSQKKVILEYLRSVTTHPTAEEIFEAVKKELPNISLATVYRNLESFCVQGLVLEIDGDVRRFDADMSDHQHFICDECGKAFDLFESDFRMKNVSERCDGIGKVRDYRVYFYGVCDRCSK